jgi:hypothetical protein
MIAVSLLGFPTPLGGDVSFLQEPAPSGLSSQSSPALRRRKLPETGSSTNSPILEPVPTVFPEGTSGNGEVVPSDDIFQSFCGATFPPPYTATFFIGLYSMTLLYV